MLQPVRKWAARLSLRGERGVSSIEYVGIAAIIVILIAALLQAAPGFGLQLGSGIDQAIDRVSMESSASGAPDTSAPAGSQSDQPVEAVEVQEDAPLAIQDGEAQESGSAESESEQGTQPEVADDSEQGYMKETIPGSSANWCKPFADYSTPVVTQSYGATDFAQTHLNFYPDGIHHGVDFGIDEGTQLYAVTSGTIIEAGRGGKYGISKHVVIQTEDGKYVSYLHMDTIGVQVGQEIKAGAPIGTSDGDPTKHVSASDPTGQQCTGYSTGAHLDIAVSSELGWMNGEDPNAYLGL